MKIFDYVDHNKLWEILKEMGVPDHFTCLLRNLYVGQEATVRTRHETMHWFKIGKGVHQSCILSPCLCNFYAGYILWNAGLDEAQAGIKITGGNINNLRTKLVEVMELDAIILVFWMLSFKQAFSLFSFTFIKRLFSSSSLSAIRVVSSAYMRLLIFLLAILFQLVIHPAQHFTWCTLHMS